ncbi:hypothetical protein GFS60_01977 [Rhodococcus sp. WAY2]|nr:hypothetical protein GFS60_01977 [Rhodococcus sp. WAY2]
MRNSGELPHDRRRRILIVSSTKSEQELQDQITRDLTL